MSEQLSQHSEKLNEPEQVETHEHHEQHNSTEESENKAVEYSHHKVEAAREKIAHEAKSGHELHVDDDQDDVPAQPSIVNKRLKLETLKRSLKHVQHQLHGSDKLLSKVTHQPVVDSLSRASEKTVARPIGILSGGLVTLIGSLIVLYNAKHYGFKYNWLLFILLFAAGYIFGTLVELLVNALSKKRS